MIAEAGLVAELSKGAFALRRAELGFLIHREPPRAPPWQRVPIPNTARDRLIERNSCDFRSQ